MLRFPDTAMGESNRPAVRRDREPYALTRARELRLEAGLPTEELHRRLLALNRLTDLGHRALSFYLYEMQQRRVFQVTGHSSAIHYAVSCLGMSRRRARELVQAGSQLADLPKLDASFREGRLSWSKVRLLTEIAVPRTQEAWIARASEVSCRELEHEVRHSERGRPPTGTLALAPVRFHIGASVDPLAHERWEEAKRRLALELGRTVTDQDLMSYGAEVALGARRPRNHARGPTPYRVVVQECPGCKRGAVQTGDGPEPLDAGSLEMVRCDALRVDPGRPPGDLDQPTPHWLREAVLARDGCRCRNCGLRWNLMVHHLVFRARGGSTTAENLVTLCGRCHSLVHAGLLRIEGSDPAELRFLSRYGRELGDDAHTP